METEYVKNTEANLIDPQLSDEYLPLEKIYLGIKQNKKETITYLHLKTFNFLLGVSATSTMNDADLQPCQANKVYSNCRNFYVTLITEIQERFSDAFTAVVFDLASSLEQKMRER